jgi:hypothetical protein
MSVFSPAQIGVLESRYGGDKPTPAVPGAKLARFDISTAPASFPLPSNPSGAVLLFFVDSSGAMSILDATVQGRTIRVNTVTEAGTVLAFYVAGV